MLKGIIERMAIRTEEPTTGTTINKRTTLTTKSTTFNNYQTIEYKTKERTSKYRDTILRFIPRPIRKLKKIKNIGKHKNNFNLLERFY